MKTPLHLLIDYLTKYDGMPTVRVIRKCHDLLAIEREQILKAHEAGSYTANETIPEAKANACKYFERAYGTNIAICECGSCTKDYQHKSDCAVHNMPAMANGQCDCNSTAPTSAR